MTNPKPNQYQELVDGIEAILDSTTILIPEQTPKIIDLVVKAIEGLPILQKESLMSKDFGLSEDEVFMPSDVFVKVRNDLRKEVKALLNQFKGEK